MEDFYTFLLWVLYEPLPLIGGTAFAAATLPLSYRFSKPFWPIWSAGFVLALGVSIWAIVVFGALSTLFGASEGNSGAAIGMGLLNKQIGFPFLIFCLSPFILAWLLHVYRSKWAGLFKPFGLEIGVVVIALGLVPLGAHAMVWHNIADVGKQIQAASESTIRTDSQSQLRLSVE